MIESNKRSISKAASWRTLATLFLIALAFLVTGDPLSSFAIGFVDVIAKTSMYYIHERVWGNIKWGKSKGLFIQMTGLSGAGKTTVATAAAQKLRRMGYSVEVIDGDEYREGLCKDLGFSKEDRNTNIRRLGFVGHVLKRNNVVAIMSAINPYEELRNEIGGEVVFVGCPLEVVEKRDTKGLYKKARSGEIKNFTGISDPYEPPTMPALTLETHNETIEESVNKLCSFVIKKTLGE